MLLCVTSDVLLMQMLQEIRDAIAAACAEQPEHNDESDGYVTD
jgi:hypothetical protein